MILQVQETFWLFKILQIPAVDFPTADTLKLSKWKCWIKYIYIFQCEKKAILWNWVLEEKEDEKLSRFLFTSEDNENF